MSIKDWFHKKHSEYENDVEYQYYYYKTFIVEKILEYLEDNNLSKNHLAEKLNVSPPYISKLLNGGNLTLKKMIEIFTILGYDYNIIIKKKFNHEDFYKSDDVYQTFTSSQKKLSIPIKSKYETEYPIK